MEYRGVITLDPGKRGGKPCIRGLRITVYDVLEYLASGMSEDPRRHSRLPGVRCGSRAQADLDSRRMNPLV
jgi:hypothetical protein